MSAGGGGELQVQRPLQPGVEADDGAVLLDVAVDLGGSRTAQLRGPGVPVAAVLLGDRCPGRPSPAAVWPCSSRQRANASPPPWAKKIRISTSRLRAQIASRSISGTVGQRAAGVVLEVDAVGAGHLGDPQVDRVAEAAGGRQVGAGLLPGDRGDGVQRVDQHEAGALRRGHPADGAQVGEVADAPARPAARRVELHRPAPGAVPRAASTGRGRRSAGAGGPRATAASGSRAGSRSGSSPSRCRTSPSSQTTSASSISSASPGRATIGARSSRSAGGRADDLAQPVDGGRGHRVLLVQGVEPARVDAPLVGRRRSVSRADPLRATAGPHGRRAWRSSRRRVDMWSWTLRHAGKRPGIGRRLRLA